MTTRVGKLRITRRWIVAAIAGAVLIALVVVDLVRPGTPHPFVGPWYYADGRVVPDGIPDPLVLNVMRGAEHCGWESVTFMEMAWPPGTRVRLPISVEGPDVRQYIRDPQGAVDDALATSFEPSATLPQDARPTGIERDPWRIFVSKSTGDRYIYLVSDAVTERWPSSALARGRQPGPQRLVLCA